MSEAAPNPNDEQRQLFIILMSSVPSPRMNSIVQGLRMNPVNEVIQVLEDGGVDPAIRRIGQNKHAVMIFDVQTKTELARLGKFLSSTEDLIRLRLFRMAGFLADALAHPKVLSYLKKRGWPEIFSPRITGKSLRYKVSRLAQLVAASQAAVKRGGAADQGWHVEWVAPLAMQSDFWIIRRTSDIKSRGHLWVIYMIGPPPVAGEWIQDPSLNSRGLYAWVFQLNPKFRHLSPDSGKWIFWGNAPRFSFQTLMWNFVSSSPRLVFVPEQAPPAVRIVPALGSIRVSKNGLRSEAFKQEIWAILSAEARFSPESQSKRPDFAVSLETQAGSGLQRSRVEEEEDGLDIPDFADAADEGSGTLDYLDERAGNGSDLQFQGGGEDWQGDLPSVFLDDSSPDDLRQSSYDQLLTDLGFSITIFATPSQTGSAGRMASAKLLDLFENLLSVELDSGSKLRQDDAVVVRFKVTHPDYALDFSVAGTVNDIESVEDGVAVVGIELGEIDPGNIKLLLSIFEGRQQSIEDFMSSAKGR